MRVWQLSMMTGAMGLSEMSAKALSGEDDAGVLLPQRLQPFAQLPGEAGIIESKPALVDDDKGGPSVETPADPVKQIGQDSRGGTGAVETFGLEGLHVGLAQPFRFGVEQPAPGSGDRIGLKRLFEGARLEKHRQSGERALLGGRGGERSEG